MNQSKKNRLRLRVKILGIESGGKSIVFLNNQDAGDLGVTASDRIQLFAKKRITAIVNTSTIKKGCIGINEEIRQKLNLRSDSFVEVEIAPFPKSLQFIRNKLSGKKLLHQEIREIVKDVVNGNLNENEITSFVTTLHIQGLDLDEASSLSSAMVETGKTLNLNQKMIVDKHSIGGVPGDNTTLLVVPIVAAAGLVIPKTSSRAITSAAGTADRAEVFMPVTLSNSQIKKIVQKSNGCIVWGGALELAPADDLFLNVEYPLHIDPLLLPSIMSKKKAVGATHLIVDIPTGRGAKMKTIGQADLLAKDLNELGRRLNIHTNCILTFGEQPIGYTVGPALEAREALEVIMNVKSVPDLFEKACNIAGSIFEMIGKRNGYGIAADIIRSGKAERKLREIIRLQGGESKIKPDDIHIGKYSLKVKAKKSGQMLWMDNTSLVDIARAAGAPQDKGAGILFTKKTGDAVLKNDILFTIYAEKSRKLLRAENVLKESQPIGIGKAMEMVIHKIKQTPVVKQAFVIDR